MSGHSGHDIHHSGYTLFKIIIEIRRIADDPCGAFTVALSAMMFSALHISTMIGGDENAPVFRIMLLTVLNAFPETTHLIIHLLDRIIKLFTVAVAMPHVIGEFQVHPRQI